MATSEFIYEMKLFHTTEVIETCDFLPDAMRTFVKTVNKEIDKVIDGDQEEARVISIKIENVKVPEE